MVGQGAKGGLVHRRVMEAVLGRKLQSRHEVVHHICANRACVNPEHLQLTSQRENMAEMMQRQYYLARITQLEAQIAEMRDGPAAGHFARPPP